jgi:hypothetical protein
MTASTPKKPRPPSPPRLYVILARKSPMAVVFRRGPSKQTQLISWDTNRHEFRAGQWFKGRIYERRCDLSPSGEKLIYFAASQKPPYLSWTAVSRPPFYTALALWPKGDCWGGGGLFKTERIIQLNHGKMQAKLADEFTLPKTITVEPVAAWAGGGEDEPLHDSRLVRDGWARSPKASSKEDHQRATAAVYFPKSEIWNKPHGRWTIRMNFLGLMQRNGPWYVIDHDITDDNGNVVHSLGRSDWADWSHSGEILFAKQGSLFRITASKTGLGKAEKLIDLTSHRFREVEPTPTALRWGGVMGDGEEIR